MKRLIFALAMLPCVAMADTGLIFDDQQAFRVCHDIAMQRTPQPTVEDLDVTPCLATQSQAYMAANDMYEAMKDSRYALIRRAQTACIPNAGQPHNWLVAFECFTTVDRLLAEIPNDDEIPSDEEMRVLLTGDEDELSSVFSDEELVRGVALNICLGHPRRPEWTGPEAADLIWELCADPMINALRASTD